MRAFRGEAIELWRSEFGLTLEQVELWGGAVSVHEGGGEVSLPMVSLMLPTAGLLKAMGCGTDLRRLKKEVRVLEEQQRQRSISRSTTNLIFLLALSLPLIIYLLRAQLNLRLWEEFAVEVPVFVWNESVAVRISYGKGVDLDGVRRLVGAIKVLCDGDDAFNLDF